MKNDDRQLFSPLLLPLPLYHLCCLGEKTENHRLKCMKWRGRVEIRTGVVRAETAPIHFLFYFIVLCEDHWGEGGWKQLGETRPVLYF